MIRAAFVLFCAAIVSAGDAPPPLGPHQSKAVIVGPGPTDIRANVWIIEETVDGLKLTLTDQADGPQSAIKRGKYERVDYRNPEEITWLQGDGLSAKGKFEDAAAKFTEAAANGRTWYTRESGFLRAAECWVKAGKGDQALKALEGLKAAFPKNVHQGEALYWQGGALAKKGDRPGALKIFNELAKRSDLGLEAVALGALGQAEQLAADKQFAEAANALASVFTKLNADRDVRLFGQIGAELAAQQIAAGQVEPAIATLRRLAYGVNNATTRAKAHVDWANMLVNLNDAKSLFLAFDHAAIATATRDAESSVTEKAATLTRQISGKIDKLPADQCSDAEKAEYRRYLTR
mgnify:CR=1 FL=1